MLLFIAAALILPNSTSTPVHTIQVTQSVRASRVKADTLVVPFYSQFKDITSTKWQKVGCGIASLAMILDYYKPAVSVDTLLRQGIAADAYLGGVGWTYKGLISVGKKYGLDGISYDLRKMDTKKAFNQFKVQLQDGPVIASVHYKFEPTNPIPHLVVINSLDGDTLYYNDPAEKTGEKQISTTDFLQAWKKKFIVIRPVRGKEAGAVVAVK